jgi:GNAT superfamily N-acetyltransferase
MTGLFSSADVALARRIEAGHAHSAAASTPGIAVEPIAGGQAIFHQPDSPMTQAIAIGLEGAVAASELDRLEAFFHSRASAAIIDLCTLADPSVLALIHERGYGVREISNVMVRRLDRAEQYHEAAPGITIKSVASGEYPAWSRLVVQGFSGQDDVPEDQLEMMADLNPWPESFFGLWDGSRSAAAAMDVHAGLATFFGDATLVNARGHGLQLALIRHRLERAAQLGCDLATASVVPGSISHRNYERAGFQLVYARVMVSRPIAEKQIC